MEKGDVELGCSFPLPLDFSTLRRDEDDTTSTLKQWLIWSSEEITRLRTNLSMSEEALDFATLALEYAENELKKSRAECAVLTETKSNDRASSQVKAECEGKNSSNSGRESLTPTARLHKATLERKRLESLLSDKEREIDEVKEVAISLQSKLFENEKIHSDALECVAQKLVEEHEIEMQKLKKKMAITHKRDLDKLNMKVMRLEEREEVLNKIIQEKEQEIRDLQEQEIRDLDDDDNEIQNTPVTPMADAAPSVVATCNIIDWEKL